MASAADLALTGIAGLDDILGGGFPAGRMYLVQGDPGVGKTTLALQFLRHGVSQGQSCLFVTLSETKKELEAVAKSHGWSLDGVVIYEAASGGDLLEEENTLYVPSEVELGERVQALLREFDRVQPDRVVIDSCSELRLLAQTPLRFRRQILALKAHLTVRRPATVLLIENPLSEDGDILLQSLVHGVIDMEHLSPLYGAARRRIRIRKLREVKFRDGYHDYILDHGGLTMFPRLVASEHISKFAPAQVSSGVKLLDELLGGGLDRGTSTLILGPAGSGKSVVSVQYAVAAAARGEHAAIFAFEEAPATMYARSAALGTDLRGHVDAGRIQIRTVNPADLSPGQFTHAVMDAAQDFGASVIVIDSVNGYQAAMSGEPHVILQLHELLRFLRQCGVATIMVLAQHGLIGTGMGTPIDVSYLADTVVLTRYFEAGGRVRKALSVLKRRSGKHENAIRELHLGSDGISVGPPLEQFRGVLTGVPTYDGTTGQGGPLMGGK